MKNLPVFKIMYVRQSNCAFRLLEDTDTLDIFHKSPHTQGK